MKLLYRPLKYYCGPPVVLHDPWLRTTALDTPLLLYVYGVPVTQMAYGTHHITMEIQSSECFFNHTLFFKKCKEVNLLQSNMYVCRKNNKVISICYWQTCSNVLILARTELEHYYYWMNPKYSYPWNILLIWIEWIRALVMNELSSM